MRENNRRGLERAGSKVGDAADFLQLSGDERRFIETIGVRLLFLTFLSNGPPVGAPEVCPETRSHAPNEASCA